VTTDQLCAAIKAVFEDTRSIVEPSGALGVAGIMQYKLPKDACAVAICSGANMTFERLQQVAERTLIGSGKEALFAVTMPEQPGALRRFCQEVINEHNISEFNYRLNRRSEAHVLVGVNIADTADKRRLAAKMTVNGFKHIDLSDDDLAKEHVRHMIGGSTADAVNEHFYEVTFPERPGALADFLARIGTDYNISLFHYRSMASDTGSVFIGFEANDAGKLETKLVSSGFTYRKVDAMPSLKTFVASTPAKA
jgi:threonine dehydratase